MIIVCTVSRGLEMRQLPTRSRSRSLCTLLTGVSDILFKYPTSNAAEWRPPLHFIGCIMKLIFQIISATCHFVHFVTRIVQENSFLFEEFFSLGYSCDRGRAANVGVKTTSDSYEVKSKIKYKYCVQKFQSG